MRTRRSIDKPASAASGGGPTARPFAVRHTPVKIFLGLVALGAFLLMTGTAFVAVVVATLVFMVQFVFFQMRGSSRTPSPGPSEPGSKRNAS